MLARRQGESWWISSIHSPSACMLLVCWRCVKTNSFQYFSNKKEHIFLFVSPSGREKQLMRQILIQVAISMLNSAWKHPEDELSSYSVQITHKNAVIFSMRKLNLAFQELNISIKCWVKWDIQVWDEMVRTYVELTLRAKRHKVPRD